MVRRIRLTVIRHLPTVGNVKRQYIGWTDEPIVKADGLNVELPWQPKTVYGSDLLRCRESVALYFPEAAYISDCRFRESNFGEWEGKTYDLLKDNKTYRSWIDNPTACKPPGGESLLEVKSRVLEALATLPEDESDYFIVAHGGPIRLLLSAFSPEPQDFWSWIIPHGSVWQLEWHNRDDFKGGKAVQVFIGGAYNGKRAYVRKRLEEQAKRDVHWIEGTLPKVGSERVVVAGLEKWLRTCGLSEEQAIDSVMKSLRNREAIVILTDIGRGIVPMDVEERQLRDACGRLYQRLLAEADEVTRVWYGIPQIIKKGENDDENLHENRR